MWRQSLRDAAHVHEMAEAAPQLPGEHDGLHRGDVLMEGKHHSLATKEQTGSLMACRSFTSRIANWLERG